MGAGLTPLADWLVGDVRQTLWIVLGAVVGVLLVACVNVANLQLARGTLRAHELAVRGALGAGRGRLVRQLLVESLALALAGGALGVALGLAGVRALLAAAPRDLPRLAEIGPHGPVLAAALAATLGSALVFGLAPALAAGRTRPASALAGRTGAAAAGQRSRALLVVAEVALAAMLAVGAGLLLRSFAELARVDPGFDPERAVAVTVSLSPARYPEPERVRGFYRDVLERVGALPGVVSAAATDGLPLEGTVWTGDFAIEGRPPGDFGVEFNHRTVSAGYFATLGVPVLAGRAFTDADDGTVPVTLINASLARHHFGEASPLGHRITLDREPGPDAVWRTIVGVVGDERLEGPTVPPRDEIFEPLFQDADYDHRLEIVARTAGPPRGLVGAIRAQVASLDPDVPVDAPRTLEQVVAGSRVRERFLTLLVGLFAAVAVVLAAIGVYGVLSFAVGQRHREIGVRMALGADGRRVLGQVMGRAMALAAAGLACGLAGALGGSRLLAGALYEVRPTDPPTFLAVAGALALTALVSSWLPARRAARTDPATALRRD
jgi:putative ABC transport system permease protein